MADYPKTEPRAKFAYGHLLTTQLKASEATLNILENSFHDLKDTYTQESTGTLADSSEAAAYVNLASILLNIDSALTK